MNSHSTISQPAQTAQAAKTVLAYLAAGYLVAAAVYKLATSCMGTPFHDSLTDSQRRILTESKAQRTKAFLLGVLVALLLLGVTRPF